MSDQRAQTRRETSRHFRLLTMLAAASALIYACIAFLSWDFDFDVETTERPIVGVLLLFAAAFVGYLFAIRIAMKAPQTKQLLGLIVWTAIIFRVTLLFSVPIQEIDIYRYLWDGTATTAGVSPFRYSPAQVRSATVNTTDDPQLRKLVRLRDEQPALAEILDRVHFGRLPTIYPPTSQLVFAAAAFTSPADAPVLVRVFIMKAWFVVIDVATLFVIIALLKLSRMPIGLCLTYAWCPLLMKEVANSGHLDAVAVFLTTLAIYLAARLLLRLAAGGTAPWRKLPACGRPPNGKLEADPTCESFSVARRMSVAGLVRVRGQKSHDFCHGTNETGYHRTIAQATVAFFVLALAVGAKLYPIILVPVFVLVFAKHLGWRCLLIPTATFALTTAVLVAPMLPKKTHASSVRATPQDSPPLPTATEATATDPSQGVATFLRHWEMNDFMFLLIVENLKPADDLSAQQLAWFSIVPNSVRKRIVVVVSERFGVSPTEAAFLVTRAITAFAFLIVAIWLAWRAARKPSIAGFCEAAFLTISWFWLLCPTQNPWYWTWALPLLPFARGRAWLAVSGLVLIYYLRFWLSYHWPETPMLGTGYVGYAFFDFIVTWLEFAPWFGWLCICSFLRWRHGLSRLWQRDQYRLFRVTSP